MGYTISVQIDGKIFEEVSKVSALIVSLLREYLEIPEGNPIFLNSIDIEFKNMALSLARKQAQEIKERKITKICWGADPVFWMQNLETIEKYLEKYGKVLIH